MTRRSEEIPLRTVTASLGPMPEMVRSFSKRRFSCGLGEAEEGDLVLADVGVDVEGGLGTVGWEGGEGGDADGDVVANASAFDDGLVGGLGEEASAEVGDHAWVILLCERATAVLRCGGKCAASGRNADFGWGGRE